MKQKITAFFCLLVLLTCAAPATLAQQPLYSASAQAYLRQAPVVYVAGNADLYPIEYFDAQTKTYQGILPQYYAYVEAETGLRFEYRNSVDTSHRTRMALAENKQVEVVSAVLQSEAASLPQIRLGAVCFYWPGKEKDSSQQVFLGYTDADTQALQEVLETSFAAFTAQQKDTAYFAAAGPLPHYRRMVPILAGTCIVLLLAGCAAAALLYRSRGHWKALYRQEKYGDAVTGAENYNGLMRWFDTQIPAPVKPSYWVVHVDTGVREAEKREGPAAAQQYTQAVAELLAQTLLPQERFCRTAENDFLLLMKEPSQKGLQARLRSLYRLLQSSTPKNRPGQLPFTLRLGLADVRTQDETLQQPVWRAGIALQEAKKKAAVAVLYDKTLEKTKQKEDQLQQDVNLAFLQEEFKVYLQPYFDAAASGFAGCEALVRWQHPVFGLLKPAAFMPLLEESGRVQQLDYTMFEGVCRLLQQRLQRGEGMFWVSCNFSPRTFHKPEFAAEIIKIAEAHSVPPGYLPIEVQEGFEGGTRERTDKTVQQLAAAGFPLVLDQFGCGSTSFRDLARYPVHMVKLGKPLVDLISLQTMQLAVQGLVHTLHTMNQKVLCNGVESSEQLETLRRLGCDFVQGYYFYQPMSCEEFAHELEEASQRGHCPQKT